MGNISNTKKGVERMSFSIRLTEEERPLAESYVKIHSMSLGEAFKRRFLNG